MPKGRTSGSGAGVSPVGVRMVDVGAKRAAMREAVAEGVIRMSPAALIQLCHRADVVVTTGGTGLAPRDVTPEGTASVVDRQAPGIAEAMRVAGLRSTSHAMLSRGIAGVRGHSLTINLPGSPKGAVESLDAVWAAVPHAVVLLKGPVTDQSHSPQA